MQIYTSGHCQFLAFLISLFANQEGAGQAEKVEDIFAFIYAIAWICNKPLLKAITFRNFLTFCSILNYTL